MILLFERTVHKSLSKFDLAVFNFPRRVSRCLLAVSSSSILVADSRFWKVENQRYINLKNQETCTEKSYKNQFFTWIKFSRKFSWNWFHGEKISILTSRCSFLRSVLSSSSDLSAVSEAVLNRMTCVSSRATYKIFHKKLIYRCIVVLLIM